MGVRFALALAAETGTESSAVVTLAPTFLLFVFYYLEKDRPWLFGVFVALTMACKEDMGLTVAMAAEAGARAAFAISVALGAASRLG